MLMARRLHIMTGFLPAFAIGGMAGMVGVAASKYYGGQRQLSQYKTPTLPSSVSLSEIAKHTKAQPLFATGDTLFVFGPGSKYIFGCRARSPVPSAISVMWKVFTDPNSLMMTKLFHTKINEPHYYTMTPHGDEFLAYTDTNTTKATWQFVLNNSRHNQAPTYSALLRWLDDNVSLNDASLKKTVVVFGPGASYFARTADSCTWHDVPRRLEDAMLKKKEAYSANAEKIEKEETASIEKEGSERTEKEKTAWIPRLVALGASDTWIAVWEDGQLASAMQPSNQLLLEFQSQAGNSVYPSLIENLALSPHNVDDYFRATKLGHLDWSTASIGEQDISKRELAVSAAVYMQMRAKDDDTSFSLSGKVPDNNVDIVISPDSGWTDEKLTALWTPTWWSRLHNFIQAKLQR